MSELHFAEHVDGKQLHTVIDLNTTFRTSKPANLDENAKEPLCLLK